MSEQVGSIHFKADTTDLERAAKALDKLAQAGPRVQSALTGAEQSVAKTGKSLATIGNSSRGLDTVDQAAKTAASGLNQAANAAEGVRTAVGRAGQSATGLDSIASGSAQATRGLNDAAASMLNLRGAIASAGIAVAAKQFIDVADSVTVLNNQLKLATGSTQAAAMAYSSLFEIAQRSRVSFTALGDTFASIARAAQPLGVSQERLLKVTESIGNAMTISGGSAQGLQAALVQLGQGLSAGTLRGEELNSVMEQAPRLAKALADGLGVTVGQLRALGSEGEITAEKVIKALESQSSVLRGEVAGATLTVSQAMTQLGNSTTFAIGELDKASGASSAAASAISGIASAIDVMGKVASENEAAIKAVFGAGAVIVGAKAAAVAIGGVTAALTAARVATIGFTAALAANPIGAALLTVTALGAAAYASGVSLGLMGDSVDALSKQVKDAEQAIADQKERLKEAGEAAADAAVELAKAEAELEKLQKRGAENSSNLFLREAYAHAQRLVNKLREAKREKDSLLASAASMSYAGDPYNDGASYQQYKDREKAAQGYNAILERRSGVTKQNTDDILKLNAALNAGVISEQQYRDEIIAINNEVGKRSGALKESKERTTQQANAYQSLAEKAAEYVRTLQIEAQQGSRLAQSQKLQIELDSLLAKGKGKINAASVAQIQSAIAIAKAMEGQAQSVKRAQAAYEDYLKLQEELADDYVRQSKAREALWLALGKSEQAIRDEAEMLALEESLIGKTNAVRDIAIARLQIERDLREEIASIDRNLDLDEPARIEARARARENAMKKIANAERKVYLSEWEKTSQMIGDTLADYIMSGGKDAATYLKRLFSTLVLQPVVQTVVSGVLGTGAAAASGVSSGGVGGIANLAQQAYSAFTSPMFSNFGMGLASNIQQFGGTLFTKGFETLGTSVVDFGNTVAQFSDAINVAGDIFGYGTAIYNLSQGKYGSAIGTAVGTYFGGPIGAMIGSTLGGLVDGMFGGGTPHTGAAAEYYQGGIVNSGKSYTKSAANNAQYTADLQGSINGVAQAVGGSFDAMATLFGQQAGYKVATGFTADGDDKSHGLFRVTNADGEQLIQWLAKRSGEYGSRKTGYGYSSDAEKGYDQYLASVTAATIPLLKDIVPTWADGMLDSLVRSLGYSGDAKDWKSIESGSGAFDALQQAVQQIAQFEAAFESLGNAMSMFSGISDEVKTSLLGGLGGMEGLTATAQSFYQSYYSEQERYEASLKQMRDVLASLNVSIDPAMGERAKADFRAAVEGAFDAGNGELSTQLLAINQAFDQVASYAAKSAQAAANAAREAANAAVDRAQFVADAAMRQLEASIDREKSYWQSIATASQTAISSLTSTLGLLTSNARDLYGTVDSAQQMMAAQGMVYVENALAAVKRGASVLDFAGLSDAISAARGGISNGAYATQFERDRDALVLAGQMSELGDLADLQLSVEERALKAAQTQIDQLDQTLQYWQEALSYDQLQIDATMSVASAVYGLDSAIRALASAQAAARAAEAASSWGSAINAVTYQAPADKAALYNEMLSSGMSDSAIRNAVYEALGDWQTDEDWRHLKHLAGVPGYASGGSHAGGLRVVGERGWELEATGPARIWNQSQLANALSGGGNAELVAEVRALRAEVAALRAANERTASNTSGLPQMVDQIDQVTEGGNAMRAEVV